MKLKTKKRVVSNMPKDKCRVCGTEKEPDNRIRITLFINNPLGKNWNLSQNYTIDKLEELQGAFKTLEQRTLGYIGKLRDEGKKTEICPECGDKLVEKLTPNKQIRYLGCSKCSWKKEFFEGLENE